MNTCDAPETVSTIDISTARKLWIHCNACFVQYVDKTNVIFLLACQHVICEKCVTANLGRTPNDAPTYTCPMCGKQVRGRQVNNALPTNLKDMFHPQPWIDGLAHDLITKFQRANHKSLLEHIKRKGRETEKLDKDLEMAQKICRKHYLNQHRLRIERKQYELHVRKVHHQERIRKKEAQRRNAQRKLSNTKFAEHAKVDENQAMNKRSVSEELQKAAITSFLHNNNHSFVL